MQILTQYYFIPEQFCFVAKIHIHLCLCSWKRRFDSSVL